jgi:alkylation response protein AidB-like acyl-CoA dehydrogenase
MYIGYDESQEALRLELRAYYEKLLTPEIRAELAKSHGIGETSREVVRQMGRDGWLGIGWPKEYGGQGRSEIEQFIFFDESMRARAPVPMLTINTVGPTLMHNGSEEQKKFFLPKILAGEVHFCIGYSEPGAGTDLAALQTRADPDGDDFVINGQKLWTSLASDADYCWLAVRTDQDAPKHGGLSMFLVDMKTPGIRIDPLELLSAHDINAVFFDDVRVPASNLVGGLNKGWKLITSQLNHERVSLCAPGMIEGAYEAVVEWAGKAKTPTGERVLLREVADFEIVEGPAQISREEGKRRVVVELNVVGRDIGGLVAEAREKIADQVELPVGYFITWGGQFEQQQRAMARLKMMVPVSLVFIFILLYLNFRDARPVFLILANIPLALVGGVIGLKLFGMYLSVSASVGFIALFGIAILNGLVMVELFRTLAAEGKPRREAVVEGAEMRLRPVLMTAATTALGLLPMVWASGVGSEVQRPLAVVVVFGVVTSTLLTLMVLPVLYDRLGSRV